VLCESFAEKTPRAIIGGQSTLQDLPFPHQFPKINTYTFVLHRKTLGHPPDTCRLPHCYKVKVKDFWSLIILLPRHDGHHQQLHVSNVNDFGSQAQKKLNYQINSIYD